MCARDPHLAHQIYLHRLECGRFNRHHEDILEEIYNLPGSSIVHRHGTRLSGGPPDTISIPTHPLDEDNSDGALDNEQASDDEEIEALGALLNLVNMSADI